MSETVPGAAARPDRTGPDRDLRRWHRPRGRHTRQGERGARGGQRLRPAHLTVDAGDTVTRTWTGSAAHNVSGEGFASEVQRGGTFTHTFDGAGVYECTCTLHSRMGGQVVIDEV